AASVESVIAKLVAANPIRKRRAQDVMRHGLRLRIDRIGTEIRNMALECRTDLRVCPSSGIFRSKAWSVVSHHMRGHVAGRIVNELAGDLFTQRVMNLAFRIARLLRHQLPRSQ